MNNKKKSDSLPGLTLIPTVDSIFFMGQEIMKKRKGFIGFKVLILIVVLILILLMVLL